MPAFVYVPYDPESARVVKHRTVRKAVLWFREEAGATSRTRAHLNTENGRCLAAYSDGEFYIVPLSPELDSAVAPV